MFHEYADPVVEVSYDSPAGLYVVLTRSSALYLIDLSDPDVIPVVSRYSDGRELLYDGEILPAVMNVRFNLVTGVGVLIWGKPDPATRRVVTGFDYVGTIRRTSTPIWIGRVRPPAPAEIRTLLVDAHRRAAASEPSQKPDA